MRQQSKLLKAVASVTGLVTTLRENLWEAIGDLRKNVGDVRLKTLDVEKRTHDAVLELQKAHNLVAGDAERLREDANRAWALAESRNSVYRKNNDDLIVAIQKLNERLSKIEGEPKAAAAFQHLTGINGRIEILEGKTGMLSECIGAHNDRLNVVTHRVENLEDLRVLYSTPYALENGDTLVITTTKPDGQGERVSAKVYTPYQYAAYVEGLQKQVTRGVEPSGVKLSAQDEAHIANGRGAAVADEYVRTEEIVDGRKVVKYSRA